MQHIVLQESQPAELLTLPYDVAVTLADLDVATFKPQPGGLWRIEAVRKVGVVRVADTQVEIQPKVPVGRLFFMMGYALRRGFWLDHDIQVDEDRSLLPAVAHAFLTQSARAISRGLLRGYRTIDESAPVVRGRPDITAQITRRGGLPLPAEIIVDEYTANIPENRILLSAARTLLSMPSLDNGDRSSLRQMLTRFDDVDAVPAGAPLPHVSFTRLNAHYLNALELASLILRYASVEHLSGTVTATAYLFDMWQIFEDFLSTALKTSLERIGGTGELQRSGEFLDHGNRIALRPDIVWTENNSVRAVMDAKYKSVKYSRVPNSDVYQMLAYCTRYGLSDGHLIYASGEEEPCVHQIRTTDIRIHCHAIDLSLRPKELMAAIDALSARIKNISCAFDSETMHIRRI
ncbi:McrC family protein [Arthrobacter sp. GCM10027362]|uniref:McrC family protein n=1 Tax=Arthrobacter sp. GCM10027362 TaxID=3273379 RepID=UPI00363EC689